MADGWASWDQAPEKPESLDIAEPPCKHCRQMSKAHQLDEISQRILLWLIDYGRPAPRYLIARGTGIPPHKVSYALFRRPEIFVKTGWLDSQRALWAAWEE